MYKLPLLLEQTGYNAASSYFTYYKKLV